MFCSSSETRKEFQNKILLNAAVYLNGLSSLQTSAPLSVASGLRKAPSHDTAVEKKGG